MRSDEPMEIQPFHPMSEKVGNTASYMPKSLGFL